MPNTQTFVIEDFKGFFQGITAPPGGVVDLGDVRGDYHSRSFQIDSDGKVRKSGLFSTIGTIFDEDASSEMSQTHGIHYWEGGGAGSTLVLAGTFGIKRSCSKSATPGTAPYMLRFDSVAAGGPSWTAFPSTDPGTNAGPTHLFGNFAEYQDRLYFCNGLDWPIRIDGIHSLFARHAALSPEYFAMGVCHPDIYSDMSLNSTNYDGKRAGASGANEEPVSTYAASIVTPYGESSLQMLEPDTGLFTGCYGVFGVTWANFEDWVTSVRLYRLPRGSSVFRLVADIPRGDTSWLDTISDADLGPTNPYDVGLPGRFRLLTTFEERMFAVGGFGRWNRVACSKAGHPDVWPATFELPLSGHLGNRTITRTAVVNGSLYFFLDRGILRLYGNSPENYQFGVQNDFVGCIAPRSLFPWQDGVVFLSRDGLYFFNGTDLKKVSGEGLGYEAKGGVPWDRACGAVSHDQYFLSYRDDTGQKWVSEGAAESGAEPNRTLSINMVNGRVGVLDDWAFGLSTPYGGSESIVVGGQSRSGQF